MIRTGALSCRAAAKYSNGRLSRRRPLRGSDPELLESAPAAGDGPLEELVRAEQRVALWRGLERLKEEDRAVLVAFYIHGRSLKQISREVHDLVTRWGGSISAEHGIGRLKRDELARLADPVALALMRQVKAALDPAGLLNPGKLI